MIESGARPRCTRWAALISASVSASDRSVSECLLRSARNLDGKASHGACHWPAVSSLIESAFQMRLTPAEPEPAGPCCRRQGRDATTRWLKVEPIREVSEECPHCARPRRGPVCRARHDGHDTTPRRNARTGCAQSAGQGIGAWAVAQKRNGCGSIARYRPKVTRATRARIASHDAMVRRARADFDSR